MLLCTRQVEPISAQANDDGHDFDLLTPPRKGSFDSKHIWECNIPQISILGVGEQQIPVMPHFESALANSLRSVRLEQMIRR